MSKYQQLLFKRTNETLTRWSKEKKVLGKDIYRFLHSIKGTAASIELPEWSEVANSLLENMDEDDSSYWEIEDVTTLLSAIIDLSNEQQNDILCPSLEKEDIFDGEKDKLVLLIEDDISMLTVLKSALEEAGLMVLVAMDAEKGINIFYDQKPDCVIIDYYLPEQDGLDVLTTIQEKANTFFIPIVMISGDQSKKTRIKGFESGADDFIVKPFDLDEFVVRVKRQLQRKDLIDCAVLLDELTGAYNRKFLNLEIEREIYEYTRSNVSFTIAMLDLDHFKNVNDTYGHAVGDEVLKKFVSYINEQKRQSDYLIRYGGEEFVLLLPRSKAKDGEKVVKRLLSGFSKEVFNSHGHSFSVTFSAGVVEVEGHDKCVSHWMKLADDALYEAKRTGRNKVLISDSDNSKNLPASKPVHIAIIDDDEVVRELVGDHFANLVIDTYDIDVCRFHSGSEFLNSPWSQQQGQYLIILDVMMPELDGFEVLQAIRCQFPESQFTVLMLTGRKSEKDIVRALELGADDYLTKPFGMGELEARVKRLLLRVIR